MDGLIDGLTVLSDRLGELLPDWALTALTLVAALLFGLLVHHLFDRLATRLVADRPLFWRSLVARSRRPLRLGIVILALAVGAGVSPLDETWQAALNHGLLIGFIVLLAWSALVALHIWSTLYLRRFKLDAEDNLLARKHVTQSRILLRVARVLILLVGAAAVLMSFDSVRQYGVSLLAAGGAAGIVVGLALQPVLQNLIAGIQLAITQPIRIDDALIVEGEWGQVEEISATYVVIKIWDWRRLIVPLGYFIERPFQNWTRETASLIGAVMLYLDHSADVAAIRARAREVVESSPLWDRGVFAVQVTDFRERVMELRVLASARNASETFDLRCQIREKLIAFIQAEMPGALPRTRGEVTLDPDAAPSPLLVKG
ncbi:mechanosensitive ion channel family protein [Frigidibacter sp. ROC022]|uniref:mechanosensitive ion channel family protein n=1 Tax=Frigidibacter sp. ROC022 TaxID=2971796 RepID=UPI00215ACD26|nr:mechanosensitive ion channel family protein [Frigidibacter sp. ROC022]MCR8723755.1 mechanosensitive ion channel family protein [Frigidibacter sp. ROC022]